MVLLVGGCERPPQTAVPTAPAGAAASAADRKLTLLAPDAERWSREDAVLLLADPALGVSAAVQLVRSSAEQPLCAPAELTDDTARWLRVVRLGERVWALGIVDLDDAAILRAPVLIGPRGEIRRPAEGTEEELLALHIAQDPEVFPHVLVSPQRVWTVNDFPPKLALTRAAPQDVGFCWAREEGWPCVVLVGGGTLAGRQICRYAWEPYELGFVGPAADVLPDPPGGKFALDMEESPLLIPVGGEIPEPAPLPQPRPAQPDPDNIAARADPCAQRGST